MQCAMRVCHESRDRCRSRSSTLFTWAGWQLQTHRTYVPTHTDNRSLHEHTQWKKVRIHKKKCITLARIRRHSAISPMSSNISNLAIYIVNANRNYYAFPLPSPPALPQRHSISRLYAGDSRGFDLLSQFEMCSRCAAGMAWHRMASLSQRDDCKMNTTSQVPLLLLY